MAFISIVLPQLHLSLNFKTRVRSPLFLEHLAKHRKERWVPPFLSCLILAVYFELIYSI